MAFIFACFQSILPFGRAIAGTFGILTYPLGIVLSFYCLAKFLGFNYSRRLKPTVYFIISLLAVLFVIHSIATFGELNKVVNAPLLKEYLLISYKSKITLLGGVGSVFAGLISILLGAMGTIILFVILATLFIGLFIDYQLYGKYEEPHIKKLKSKKLREKVFSSDKNATSENVPDYSFSDSDNPVIDEITIDANEAENGIESQENPVPIYTTEEVIGEITNQDIDNSYSNYTNVYTGLNSNTYGGYEEPQQQNTFSNDIYKSNTYPDVYTSDLNDYRRQFLSDTFGIQSASEPQQNEYETQNNFEPSTPVYTDNFGQSTNFYDDNQNTSNGYETSSVNDEISKILNGEEGEIETEIRNDITENFDTNSFGFTAHNDDEEDFSAFEQNAGLSLADELIKPQIPEPPKNSYESRPANTFTGTINPQKNEFEIKNAGFGINPKPIENQVKSEPQAPKFTVPAKDTKVNPYGFNVGMAGVRYNPPPLSLLKTPVPDTGDYTEEQNRKSAQLENVLSAFNIPAKVKNIVRGPKITRYELSVPLGVSVKKIPSYEDDIAAALAAKTITIKAPIPGSSYVGIELENDTFTSVYERELLESDAFQNCKDPLPIAIGKDISGEIIVKSLAKLVHMLVAGSTGSGKSVFIHNIILSLIYKSSPDDLRLILIDPKKVEFNMYNGLPHLLLPEVVATNEKAISALKWAVKEMERRYELMSKAGFNNIEPYNKSELVKAGQFEKFPYIVIIVDELAELIMANKKEVEACIQRLTQLARACGMHLILATQRPSVDVISGVIKNNVPTRVAFSLQSGIDSKTILNSVGAEKLLGGGDMIFAPTGTSATPRLQAAYATDPEIKAVIDYDIKNNTANYDETVASMINAEPQASPDDVGGMSLGSDGSFGKESVDNYFKTALKIFMQNNAASTSYLQRRLSIGYSRAARIMDQMEEKGYIGPATGKVRKVLITPEQFKEDFGEDYDSID